MSGVDAGLALPDELARRFELRGVLGRGASGVVLRVLDRELGREVALKTLPQRGEDEAMHLRAEFRLLAHALHPNLVELYELFSGERHCFFTMELVAGTTYDAHVAAGGAAERVARVTATLPQLVQGIAALHAADALHRDIKPSNILVTREGRVVLLDFGLSQRLRAADGAETGAGTWAYMAPEAVWGRAEPAADWYSLGVVLHEAIAGALPFAGEPAVSLARKQRGAREPLPASVPAWLSALVADLLAPEPEARPDAAALQRRLAAAGLGIETPTTSGPASARPFVGRDEAWQALRAAFEAAERGASVVAVRGPSGIGKSELIERFARHLEARHGALVLRGRCHPQEQVPYNALDHAVDELARYLAHPLVDGARLSPRQPAAAARLFPVLRRLPEFAGEDGDPAQPPNALRRRGAEALAEILAQIAASRPVVLALDDVHWGDRDSAEVLALVVQACADAQLLVALGHRDDEEGAFLRQLRELPWFGANSREVPLAALSADEARALATALLRARGVEDAGDADDLVAAAAGSPFLLDALVRDHHGRPAANGPTGDRVADLVERRLAALDADARAVVELTALSAAPLASHLVFQAAGVEPGRRPLLRRLEREGLVRSGAFGGRSKLDIHHDRIRQAVVGRIEPPRLRAYHLALAEALAPVADAEPELVMNHYLGAGRPELAAGPAVRAAERASAALAFDRAAALFRRALALTTVEAERRPLRARIADALVNAGRGGEAAEQYLEASRVIAATTPNDPDVAALRSKAAEHFVRIGRMDEGVALFREVLAGLGVPLPRAARSAMARSMVGRVRLLLPGARLAGEAVELRLRPDAAVSADDRRRLDLMWRASTCFGLSQHALADYLGVESLRLALAAGDRWSVARALGYEATFESALGGPLTGRSQRMLTTVAALLADDEDPYRRAFLDVIHGTWAWNRGRWRDCVARCDAAIARLERHCPGSEWETAVARVYALSARAMSGAWAELATLAERALDLARERGDLFSSNNYRLGELSLYRLAADDPGRARALAAEAEASWPRDPHHTQRYYHAVLLTQVELYEDDARAAWEQIAGAWPMLQAGQYLQIEGLRAGLWFLRGRAALALARVTGPRRGRWPWSGGAAAPVREVERAVAALAHSRMPTAAPYAATLQAGLWALRGETTRAAEAASAAASGYARAEMAAHQEVLGLCAARLRGADGRAHETWLHHQGVRRPDRIAAVLAPGL